MTSAGSDHRIPGPPGPPGADRLPTLTEVVELPQPAAPPATHMADLPRRGGWYPDGGVVGAWPAAANAAPHWAVGDGGATLDADDGAAAAPPLPIDPEALVAQVLQALAPRIDLLFEARLRDAVAPALARAAQALVHDAREDLAAALRALVEQTVAQELEQRAAR